MIPLAYVTLCLWMVVGPVLFATLPKRRAVLIIYIAGFLFLPEMPEFPVHSGTPPVIAIRPIAFFVTKINAMSYGFLAGLLFFDRDRLLAFRPRWFDLPIAIWCVCPFFSALANPDDTGHLPGIRPLPGVIMAIQQTMAWGMPYLAGRLYFNDLEGLHELTRGLILGGLAYAPLCLAEKVVSPQLHNWIYGYHAHDFSQAIRSGYRPTVFLEHGLMVALWMVAATLLAAWVWSTHSLRELPWWHGQQPLPMVVVCLMLVVATVAMNSAGALALGLVGAGVLFLARAVPMRLALVVLMTLGPLYIFGRTWAAKEPTGWLHSSFEETEANTLERRAMAKPLFAYSSVTMLEVEEYMVAAYNKDRADSMLYRFKQEDKLMEKALLRPGFGWGGEGRARLYNPKHEDMSIVDGLWIQVLGDRGFFGLTVLVLTILVPVMRFTYTYPSRLWSHPALAPAAALSLILALWMIDDLSNAMINPLFIISAGSLGSVIGLRLPEGGELASPKPLPAPEAQRPFTPPTRRLGQADPQTQRPGVLRRRLRRTGPDN